MTLTCKQSRDRMEAAAWGRMDEAARSALRDHAGQCRECAGELEFMERLRAERDGHARSLPPPVYFEGVLAEIHARMPRVQRAKAPIRLRVTREWFASGLMAALALIWFGSGMTSTRMTGETGGSVKQGTPMIEPSTPPRRIAGAAGPDELVLVQGLGLVRRDSELLQLSRREMIDLGLIPPDPARG